MLAARSLRELLRPRSALIGLVGFVAITAVWYRGGESWLGLLTALVGMVVALIVAVAGIELRLAREPAPAGTAVT